MSMLVLNIVAPHAVLVVGSLYWRLGVTDILRQSAFGWDVWGIYSPVVVWCVWWPAWIIGSVNVLGRPHAK